MPNTISASRAKVIAAEYGLSWPPSQTAIGSTIRRELSAQRFIAVEELRRLLRFKSVPAPTLKPERQTMNQELKRLVKAFRLAQTRLQASYREDTMGNYLGDPAARTAELNKAAFALAEYAATTLVA